MISFRPLTANDHATVCNHRQLMFAEMSVDAAALATASATFAEWLAPRLADGCYFGFLAEDEGEVIAGIGLLVMDFPPHPNHPESNRRGFVLNVYVAPGYRGQGIAQDLMQLGEEEFKRRGIGYATLHASAAGRPIYEKLGWKATTEMGKKL